MQGVGWGDWRKGCGAVWRLAVWAGRGVHCLAFMWRAPQIPAMPAKAGGKAGGKRAGGKVAKAKIPKEKSAKKGR